MKFEEFNTLIGQDSYVRCMDKKRIDPSIVSEKLAKEHIFSGGQVGWWVREGYIVVDIDEGQEEALKVINHLKLKTLICKTPKGLHLYFKCTKEFPQRVGMILPCGLKCDFRCANKGYVLLPWGSENRAFNNRRIIADLPIEFTPMAERKDSLLGKKEGEGRNSLLFAHLMAYKNKGATGEQIKQMANCINRYIFSDPMEKDELDRLVQNTERYDAKPLGDNPYLIYNSKGIPSNVNARAVCDYFVNEGKIFVLGGECYRYQDGVYVEASSNVRNTIREMIGIDNLINQSKLMEIYRLIIDDIRIQRSANDLNINKNLINFKNGCWDIVNQKIIPHDSQYLQTIQIPHEVKGYKPIEDTKLWKFLELTEMTPKNRKMILQYMAYCLTLDYGLKTFMMLVGQSNTGKSVLIRFMEQLIGKCNISNLSMHELNMRFYPAQLYNKLMNSCADNSALPLNSIENLKKITGGDQIMHEKKGKEPFFFVSFAKLIFSFNQLPLQLEEKSNAFYKRMRILYMNKELFLDNAYVNDLCSDESVTEVIPYLLSLLPLREICRTKKSDELVESLREDSDSIYTFLTKMCEIRPGLTTTKSDLYDEYVKFCMESGREAHKKQAFFRHMRSNGYKEIRTGIERDYCYKDLIVVKPTKGRRKVPI